MPAWVAISYGALDVEGTSGSADDRELIVLPTVPSEPIALIGAGAELWQRMVEEGPLDHEELTDEERQIVAEMAIAGLVSNDLDHRARCSAIPRPWLSSPMHELVYALVASVARDHNASAIFIKGPALHAQGLREREHSGDVDLWVKPGTEHALAATLEPWGWSAVPFQFADPMYHSLTLEPADWACELDLHYRFPGLGPAEQSNFEIAVQNTVPMTFAGVVSRVPSPALHAVLFALNQIRPGPTVIVSADRVASAAKAVRMQGDSAIRIASELGALPALYPAIRTEFPELPAPTFPVPQDWHRRHAKTAAGYHLAIVRSLPWRHRLRATWQVLWPDEQTVQASSRRRGKKSSSIVVERLRRLAYGTGELFRWKQR